MTLRTNARLAGIAFLLYIIAAMSGLILASKASAGETTASRLASIAAHAMQFRTGILLELLGCLCAIVLAVTLWAITREVDPDLSLFAAFCRVAEGVTGLVSLETAADKLRLATGAH